MNLKELKEIIDFVTSKDTIEELEIEKSGVRLRIKRASNHAVPHAAAADHAVARFRTRLPDYHSVRARPRDALGVRPWENRPAIGLPQAECRLGILP